MIQHDIITLISTHTLFQIRTTRIQASIYFHQRDRHPSITRNKRFSRTIFKPWPSNRPWPTIFSPFLATVLIFSTPWVLVNVGQTRATCIFRQSANLFVPWAFVNAFVTYLLRVQRSTPWPRGYLSRWRSMTAGLHDHLLVRETEVVVVVELSPFPLFYLILK